MKDTGVEAFKKLLKTTQWSSKQQIVFAADTYSSCFLIVQPNYGLKNSVPVRTEDRKMCATWSTVEVAGDKLTNQAISLHEYYCKHSGMACYYPSCPVEQSDFVYSEELIRLFHRTPSKMTHTHSLILVIVWGTCWECNYFELERFYDPPHRAASGPNATQPLNDAECGC